MISLGKTDIASAEIFVQQNVGSMLRSLSGNGLRRVGTMARGEELEHQKAAFALIATEVARHEHTVVGSEPVPGHLSSGSAESSKRTVLLHKMISRDCRTLCKLPKRLVSTFVKRAHCDKSRL